MVNILAESLTGSLTTYRPSEVAADLTSLNRNKARGIDVTPFDVFKILLCIRTVITQPHKIMK